MKSDYSMNNFWLFLLLCFCFQGAYSQKQANIWYFGNKAGIDFNASPPLIISNSAMETAYSCASIADEQGNLLFYTNGETVWNRNHQVMYNGEGLLGNIWANQGALIVPQPGAANLYYLFTVAAFKEPYHKEPAKAVNDGLRYSIIDINQADGMGAVISKNNLLYAPSTEKLTGVRAADCGFWLITHPYGNNEYWVYKISHTGLDTVPVISKVGLPHAVDKSRVNGVLDRNAYSRGQLKCSPDGAKLACVRSLSFGESTLEIFDFDASTGMLSNVKQLYLNPNFETNESSPIHYAAEFSPDNTKLYTASTKIWQFNLADIYPVAIEVGKSRGENFSSMQLAPDGKIYCTSRTPLNLISINSLSIIHKPNEIGLACNYALPQTNFDSGGRRINDGLPNFIQSYFSKVETDFTLNSICAGKSISFSGSSTLTNVSWQWDFGDPGSGYSNRATVQQPMHTFSKAGTFTVTLKATSACGESALSSKQVNLFPDPIIRFETDTLTQCYNQVPVEIIVPQFAGTSLQWAHGPDTPTILADKSGWYKATASNPCATRSDSLYLHIIPQATAYLPDDTIVCEGKFARLDAKNIGASYRWNTGETTQIIEVDRPGKYWVEIQNSCSVAIDTANLVFISQETGSFTTNVFTPNGDGLNDTFVNYVINSPGYRMRIVNRWGKEVFFSTNAVEHWDGRTRGQQALAGVYFYYITTRDCRGEPLQLKGSVTLLR
jgi:gliding motility-associated-like protein